MTPMIGALLAASFLVAVVGLMGLVWAIWRNQFDDPKKNAMTVFVEPEAASPEEPTLDDIADLCESVQNSKRRSDDTVAFMRALDASSSQAVMGFILSSVFWLVLGSVLGLIASLKLHMPDLLTQSSALTFGTIRALHLNMVAYGWLSMAGVGVATIASYSAKGWPVGLLWHGSLEPRHGHRQHRGRERMDGWYRMDGVSLAARWVFCRWWCARGHSTVADPAQAAGGPPLCVGLVHCSGVTVVPDTIRCR